jgi:hypothetical protein
MTHPGGVRRRGGQSNGHEQPRHSTPRNAEPRARQCVRPDPLDGAGRVRIDCAGRGVREPHPPPRHTHADLIGNPNPIADENTPAHGCRDKYSHAYGCLDKYTHAYGCRDTYPHAYGDACPDDYSARANGDRRPDPGWWRTDARWLRGAAR